MDKSAETKETVAVSNEQVKPPSEDFNCVDYDVLADGKAMVWVELKGVRYSLKRTRSGRLVLHK
ncbi:MAG: hemin uptake protein HemP [Planctomycetota bacterium]